MSDSPSSFEQKASSLLQLLVSDDVQSYQNLYERLREARATFNELVADRLESAFNEHVCGMASETLEHKQNVAKYVNAQLRPLGLAIECPKTKYAALLSAGPGHDPAHGRYRVVLIGSSNENRSTVAGLKELPRLRLVPRPERVEPASDLWRRKSERGDENRGR
ncbi:MAG: hypothetical protein ABL982_10515 [Vicinamibacterales bacterium]